MDFVYIIDVSLRQFLEYDYIIVVNEGKLPFNAGQYYVHGMLQCAVYIAKSERHTYKVIETIMEGESSLIFVCIIILSLPVCAITFYCQKDYCFTKRVYDFVRACIG